MLAAALLMVDGKAFAQALTAPLMTGVQESPVREKIFNAQIFILENGLQIVVIPNHRAPVVTHMVWYKVGAAEEEEGHSGVAHFLEHLMFKGSPGLAPGEYWFQPLMTCFVNAWFMGDGAYVRARVYG